MTQRILIYRLGSLGDTLVALPAFHLVARQFPGSERRVLTDFGANDKAAPIAAVLDGTNLVHGYFEYPRQLRDPGRLRKLIADIRGWNPQLLVYMNEPRGKLKAWRDAAFFRACGIQRMVGIPYSKDLQEPQFNAQRTRYEHKTERLARSLVELGDSQISTPASWDLNLSASERETASRVIQPLNGSPGIIAASIGAKVDVKDWGDENWKKLLSEVSARLPGWGLAMIGAPIESERTESLLRHWEGPSVNLCGMLTLRESAAVLEQAKIYVGHDSGPMHLTAAVGTPCIAIFSARNLPGEWFPYGDNHTIFYNKVDCFGCRLDTCESQKKRCILSIDYREVSAAIVARCV